MFTEIIQEKAAYLVQGDGRLALNDTGADLVAQYRRMRTEHDALEASWAGAVLVRLFMKHAWLDALTLSFTATPEYDDSGGYYRCVGCNAQAVRTVPQQPLPEDLFPGGEFDPDAAAQLLEAEFEDDQCDLYAALSGTSEGYRDLDVTLTRLPIAALLMQSPIDGRVAFHAWGLAQPAVA